MVNDGRKAVQVASRVAGTAALVGLGTAVGYSVVRWLGLFTPLTAAASLGALPSTAVAKPERLVVITSACGCGGLHLDDAVEIVKEIYDLEPGPLSLALHMTGSSTTVAKYLARAIRKSPHTVTAYVPYFALSGGTILALSADEIVMDESAMLGPVDPQLWRFSAHDLADLARTKPIAELDEQFYLLGRESEKALAETLALVRELVNSDAAVARLMGENTTHGHPITFDEAVEMGLRVRRGVPKEIRDYLDRVLLEQKEDDGPLIILR